MAESRLEKNLARTVYNALAEFTKTDGRGPFTTLYWDNAEKDNKPQQSMTFTVEGKTFEVLIREK